MSSLERITDRILEEARKEAEKSLEALDQKKAEILADGKRRALALGEKMIEKAKKDSHLDKERAIASAGLKARDNILSKRLAILDSCFEKAKEELRNISDDRYLDFLKKTLASLKLDGKESIIVPEDKRELVKGLIKPSEKSCDSGFIIEKEGISYNFQFDELIDYRREEIQDEIYRLLFLGKE